MAVFSFWVHADTNTLDSFARSSSWAFTSGDSTANKSAVLISGLGVFEDTFALGGVTSWGASWAGFLKDSGAFWKASVTLEAGDRGGDLIRHATASGVTVVGWVGSNAEFVSESKLEV